jgi:hypothetical protein
MINPVSTPHASNSNQASQPALPKAQPQQKSSLPQDTVNLKSTSDVNHDGDSK